MRGGRREARGPRARGTRAMGAQRGGQKAWARRGATWRRNTHFWPRVGAVCVIRVGRGFGVRVWCDYGRACDCGCCNGCGCGRGAGDARRGAARRGGRRNRANKTRAQELQLKLGPTRKRKSSIHPAKYNFPTSRPVQQGVCRRSVVESLGPVIKHREQWDTSDAHVVIGKGLLGKTSRRDGQQSCSCHSDSQP